MSCLTQTNNGALALSTTNDPRLNLFFRTTRDIGVIPGDLNSNSNNDTLFKMIDDSWEVNPLHTMKILFNWRDCRGGKGDHRGFLVAMTHIIENHPEWFEANMSIIPEVGSWLDLIKLWHFTQENLTNQDNVRSIIMQLLISTLNNDISALETQNNKITLLAKWLPSENSLWDRFYKNKQRFVLEFCRKYFGVKSVTRTHIKMYRRNLLGKLRNHLQIVESKMCANDYSSINYESVPSLAMTKYRKAFWKNDNERFNEYLQLVTKGEKKINSSQIYPHDLVRKYINSRDNCVNLVIEEQWKAIKKVVKETGAFDKSICVCDVSGSMEGTPMEVSVALGLLGLYENKVITFSENPELHFIPDGTLYDQVQNILKMAWGCNTNFEKTMDLILGLCHRSPSNAIEKVYVFSDMQFDMATRGASKTQFNLLREKFETSGVKMPQIIFWNLCSSNNNNFPVSCDDRGVVMLSGYSPSLLQSVIEGTDISPMSVLMRIINSPRYDIIKSPETIA